MRKFKLDYAIFQDEYGTLASNAFEVLNHTFGSEYGRCKLFREAISLVCENFAILEDNKKNNKYNYNREYVIEHFDKVTKMYYKLLKIRKKIDYKKKFDNIKKDF